MGNYTTNLSLYNTDMNTDGNDTFDFQRDLNDNNDKIDSAIGKLSTLTTTDKSSLVNAIIEIVTNLGGKTSKSLDDLNAVGQAVLDKKVEVEALLQQNGYAKFSWKENNQISNLIIQWGRCNVYRSTVAQYNFTTSFDNGVLCTLATHWTNNAGYAVPVGLANSGLTNFQIVSTADVITYWFAVGY